MTEQGVDGSALDNDRARGQRQIKVSNDRAGGRCETCETKSGPEVSDRARRR